MKTFTCCDYSGYERLLLQCLGLGACVCVCVQSGWNLKLPLAIL